MVSIWLINFFTLFFFHTWFLSTRIFLIYTISPKWSLHVIYFNVTHLYPNDSSLFPESFIFTWFLPCMWSYHSFIFIIHYYISFIYKSRSIFHTRFILHNSLIFKWIIFSRVIFHLIHLLPHHNRYCLFYRRFIYLYILIQFTRLCASFVSQIMLFLSSFDDLKWFLWSPIAHWITCGKTSLHHVC